MNTKSADSHTRVLTDCEINNVAQFFTRDAHQHRTLPSAEALYRRLWSGAGASAITASVWPLSAAQQTRFEFHAHSDPSAAAEKREPSRQATRAVTGAEWQACSVRSEQEGMSETWTEPAGRRCGYRVVRRWKRRHSAICAAARVPAASPVKSSGLPSLAPAMAVTPPSWFCSVPRSRQDSVSHSRTTPSAPPETRTFPRRLRHFTLPK